VIKGDYLTVFEPPADGVEEEPNHKISETSFNIESSQISLIVDLLFLQSSSVFQKLKSA